MLALLSVLLVGFAPVAWVFSQSTGSVVAMGVLHLVFWWIAAWFALRFLNQGIGSLGDSTGGFKVWVCIFIMVVLQMTTTLRPLIGTAPTLLPEEKKFFVVHWMDSMDGKEDTPNPTALK
jgi:predicted PurR-regulated permease PerM